MPYGDGIRARWGVLTPAANTTIEHDFNMIRPTGITFHVGRMYADPALDSNTAFERFVAETTSAIDVALRDVLECEPDYIILGISAPAWEHGLQGELALTKRIEKTAQRRLTTPPIACVDALRKLKARRISILSPYQPVGDQYVVSYLKEAGFEIVRYKGLKCSSATAIAKVMTHDLVPAIHELNGPDVDAIVQVGANLSMVCLADAAELWLDKPVIALNAVTLWHALRANGFNDQFSGFGKVLREL
jgi:maleate isomerase